MSTALETQPRELTWLERAHIALGLIPVFLFTLYSANIRVEGKYLKALLSAANRGDQATVIDRLFFYRWDILILGLLAPLIIIALSLALRRARVAQLAFWLSTALIALLYINLQSWGQTGRFMTWQGLVNAISFGLSQPDTISSYLSLKGISKTIGLVIISAAIFLLSFRLIRWPLLSAFAGATSWLLITGSAVLASVGFSSTMPRSAITQGFATNAVMSMVPGVRAKPLSRFDAADLDKAFESLTLISHTKFAGPNFGSEANSNLLIFVLETGSIEFLDIRNGLPDHPMLVKLQPRLYAARNHYSTFPASAESNMSMLLGVYPPRAFYDTCVADMIWGNQPMPGPIQTLTQKGYLTAAYAPYKSQVPMDKVLFERSGFAKVFYGQSHPVTGRSAEQRSLDELTKDLQQWSRERKPFVAAYFPQFGHGPWHPSLGRTVAERGHRVAMKQLDWLSEIVNQLERDGQLQRTTIVITGDHGVRTSEEDPNVRVGMIDAYSLHVPLLIFAPNSDLSTADSTWPTSHVDVAATIDQLVGLSSSAAMQGLSLDNPKIKERRQFFMANWYFGADGYRDPVESAMHSSVLGISFARHDKLVRFESSDVIPAGPASDRISGNIVRMLDLQEAWLSHRICGRQ